ncbi:MAG: EamA family transporter [Thermosynechococcaceae cyanobacterium]
MTWLILAGLTAVFESIKDVLSKRSLPFVDIYLVSWSLFALMLPVLAGCWAIRYIPPLGPQFVQALVIGGTLNAIAVLFYIQALNSGDLSLTVPVVALTPLFLLVTAPWLVGEYPTGADIVGVILIVAGSYVLNLNQKQNGYLAPFRAMIEQPGPRSMLIVAFLWSLTSNFDKIGVLNSTPTFWVIALFSFVAIALLPIIAVKSHRPLAQLQTHYPSLLLIGGLSSLTVLLQMQAIQIGLVTRVIAIKRMSALLGVLWGYLFFKETGIQERFLGTILMIAGVFAMMLA